MVDKLSDRVVAAAIYGYEADEQIKFRVLDGGGLVVIIPTGQKYTVTPVKLAEKREQMKRVRMAEKRARKPGTKTKPKLLG